MSLRSLVLAFALALALVGAAGAGTLRVPADHATIQAAVDAAVTGDTIEISKGTYAPFTVASKSGITLRGKGKPVVDGGGGLGALVAVGSSSAIVLDDLVIRNSGERGVLVSESTDVTIRRCTVEQVTSEAIRSWGSSGLLIEKNAIAEAGGGIDFSSEGSAAPTADSVVQKNRFEGVREDIDVDGPNHRIEKNTISDSDGIAIRLQENATNATVAKNKLTNADTAMELRGSGHVAEKNKVKGARNEGIVVVASNCRIEKNKLEGATDDAIDLEGDDNEILSNKIKDTGGNGIEISPASGDPFPVAGNLIEKNKISDSGENGIFVDTAGNTFRANKASKSNAFDLLDEAGSGANVYEGNKFGSESIP